MANSCLLGDFFLFVCLLTNTKDVAFLSLQIAHSFGHCLSSCCPHSTRLCAFSFVALFAGSLLMQLHKCGHVLLFTAASPHLSSFRFFHSVIPSAHSTKDSWTSSDFLTSYVLFTEAALFRRKTYVGLIVSASGRQNTQKKPIKDDSKLITFCVTVCVLL